MVCIDIRRGIQARGAEGWNQKEYSHSGIVM